MDRHLNLTDKFPPTKRLFFHIYTLRIKGNELHIFMTCREVFVLLLIKRMNVKQTSNNLSWCKKCKSASGISAFMVSCIMQILYCNHFSHFQLIVEFLLWEITYSCAYHFGWLEYQCHYRDCLDGQKIFMTTKWWNVSGAELIVSVTQSSFQLVLFSRLLSSFHSHTSKYSSGKFSCTVSECRLFPGLHIYIYFLEFR